MIGHNNGVECLPPLRADSLAVLYSIHATKGHTNGAFFRGKEEDFFAYRSHQRSGSHRRKKAFQPLFLNYRVGPLVILLALRALEQFR